MKTLKSYQDFTNEEIDWKKGIVTTALGASLAMSTPSLAKGDVINKIETVLNKCNWVHFDNDNELFSDYLQGATQTRV